MAFSAGYYTGNEAEWDKFMLQDSMNGTFLQTRRFIDYHKEGRFADRSVCIRKGNELAAAILGCEINDNGKKVFFAHKGTTFGGITISPKAYSASAADEIMRCFEEFLIAEGFDSVYLKMVPTVYQRKNTDLLDYFLYKNGYFCFNELNYYIDLNGRRDDVTAGFSSSKRRDYRYSLKNGLVFKKLETREEIAAYYEVLLKNLNKLGLKAVHSLDELFDIKFARFDERVEFYGVYLDDKIIAGSMIFIFDDDIFHTQYLSSDEEYLKMFPMDYLIANLIQTAANRNMRLFTFGICTEDQGRYLNLGLSRFKEGFGTEFCVNRSYEKVF